MRHRGKILVAGWEVGCLGDQAPLPLQPRQYTSLNGHLSGYLALASPFAQKA